MSSGRITGGAGKRIAELERALEEARTEAEASQRAKEQWLANITHELRTPMHGIISFARFGMKNVADAEREKLASYFEQINSSAERLMSLLNNLLDLSKSTSAQQVYVFEKQDVEDLIHAVVFEFNAALREKGLTVALRHPPGGTAAECDGGRIRQVLSNLLVNAIKYSPEGCNLEFFIEHEGEEDPLLCVGLKDEGVGIPEAELEAVFDQFMQSSRTRTKAGGTGLGLAICREIIRAHGGRIWARNNEAGPGCCIMFQLPRAQAQSIRRG